MQCRWPAILCSETVSWHERGRQNGGRDEEDHDLRRKNKRTKKGERGEDRVSGFRFPAAFRSFHFYFLQCRCPFPLSAFSGRMAVSGSSSWLPGPMPLKGRPVDAKQHHAVPSGLRPGMMGFGTGRSGAPETRVPILAAGKCFTRGVLRGMCDVLYCPPACVSDGRGGGEIFFGPALWAGWTGGRGLDLPQGARDGRRPGMPRRRAASILGTYSVHR